MSNIKSIQKTPTGSKALPPRDAFETLKDSQGRFRTKSLFVEMKHPDYSAPYTLKDYDHKGAMSMYQKYMAIGDPTEYEQAIALLGSGSTGSSLQPLSGSKNTLTNGGLSLRSSSSPTAIRR